MKIFSISAQEEDSSPVFLSFQMSLMAAAICSQARQPDKMHEDELSADKGGCMWSGCAEKICSLCISSSTFLVVLEPLIFLFLES